MSVSLCVCRLSRQRLSDDDDDNDDDEDMEDIANFESELSRNDETADAHKIPTQKPKRGRKMTMTTKDTDAMCTTIEESTTILSDNVQLSLSAKKKKRGRKSVTNQTRQETNSKEDTRTVVTASTSDEDEECSFANCIRPTGERAISCVFILFGLNNLIFLVKKKKQTKHIISKRRFDKLYFDLILLL